MKKIGIIHTTSATIASLNQLVKEKIPGTEVINFLDDSILGDMRDGHDVEFVRERWISYARTLEKLGVDAVLSACSTVGEFAEEANEMLGIPVYRIDEAMCEKAVDQGTVISVFATLQSTLTPTVNLVERKAKEAGKGWADTRDAGGNCLKEVGVIRERGRRRPALKAFLKGPGRERSFPVPAFCFQNRRKGGIS